MRTLSIALLLLIPTYAAAEAAAEPRPGRRLYVEYCSTCHGLSGDGQGPSTRYLDEVPTNFQKSWFKFRSTPSGTLPTDQDLVRTILEGVPGTPMPAWRRVFTEAEAAEIVAYLKTLSTRFEKEATGKPIELPNELAEREEDSEARGRGTYLLMGCWTCHGLDARGRGPASKSLRDSEGRHLQAANFTQDALRSGPTPLDTYRTLLTGMNGTPMSAYPAELFLYDRDSLEGAHNAVPRERQEALKAHIATLPPASEVSALDDAQKQALTHRRISDLVYYLWSLRTPDFFRAPYQATSGP